MERVLFVSNGNGEIAIADRIAQEVRAIDPSLRIDHLALVGISRAEYMRDVGPQQRMPSGGLIAMGQLGNIARDVGAGLIGLTLAQRRFLVEARGRYDRVVAVGDAFALFMALATRATVLYVGTAKSVRVSEYGPFERSLLRRASAVFVRDEETAQRLSRQGVNACFPGNVIVDLFATDDDDRADDAVAGFAPALAIFPGSRENAYADARFLAGVVKDVAATHPHAGAVLSIAPVLDSARFEAEFARDWEVVARPSAPLAFELRSGGRTLVRAWRGPIGPLLRRVQLVIGQAGTANEAAAAAGIPVVAFERGADRKTAWYRMRQRRLLGDALAVVPGEPNRAAAELSALLADAQRRVRMGSAGHESMGAPGGALAIARAVVSAA